MYPIRKSKDESEFVQFLRQCGNELDIDVKNHSLEKILQSDLYKRHLPESWSQESFSRGKLKTCARICGIGFDGFDKQFVEKTQWLKVNP